MIETLLAKNKKIERAHNEFSRFTADDNLRDVYESRQKYILDYNSGMYAAEKKGIEKGHRKRYAQQST